MVSLQGFPTLTNSHWLIIIQCDSRSCPFTIFIHFLLFLFTITLITHYSSQLTHYSSSQLSLTIHNFHSLFIITTFTHYSSSQLSLTIRHHFHSLFITFTHYSSSLSLTIHHHFHSLFIITLIHYSFSLILSLTFTLLTHYASFRLTYVAHALTSCASSWGEIDTNGAESIALGICEQWHCYTPKTRLLLNTDKNYPVSKTLLIVSYFFCE